MGDTRGLSGRCVFCSGYKLLLSKTNEIGLLKGSRGVEVTFQSTLNRTMMIFGFFSCIVILSGVSEFSLLGRTLMALGEAD